MATIPGVGPQANPPVNRTPPDRPAGTDQLRQFTEREPTSPAPAPAEDRVELARQEAPPPPEAPPPEAPPPDTTPTARQAATGNAQTTANYNEQNPGSPVAEQEVGGTVNVKI